MKHVMSVVRVRKIIVGFAALCLFLPAGCGGTSGSGTSQPVLADQSREQTISVSLSPSALTTTVGKGETFTATVTGSDNKGVSWSIQEGGAGGSITDGGRYTAPSKPGTYHVIARSKANPDKKATATVTVNAAQPAITVTIAPTTLTIIAGKSETFTATVVGSDNKAVTWSIQEGAAAGSITDGGRYTAPTVPGTYHVIATSKASGDKKAVATVTVKADPLASITVSVKPISPTILVGKSETLTATVTGTDNKAVTWSVQEGSKGGSVTDGGRYTAPNLPGIYHVVATSKANPDKKAIVTVTVKAI